MTLTTDQALALWLTLVAIGAFAVRWMMVSHETPTRRTR